jgi:hypothetical protein
MPVPINSATARLLTGEGRQEALENLGLPSSLSRLAMLMTPDPTTPYAFGALKLTDLAMRRTAPLARARMSTVLSNLGDTFPDRVWQFLQQHPQLVEVRSTTTRLPTPPGSIGRVLGRTRFPEPPVQGPIEVAIHQRAPDRVGVLAHELAKVAVGLAGRQGQPLPGLLESYLGYLPLYTRHGSRGMDAALFPALFDQPSWVRIHQLDDTLQALREWFPVAPASPPVPGGW